METHVKVVGVLNIVFAALGLCLAAVLGLIFAGSAAAVAADADADARIAIPILGLTGSALVGFLVVWSLPCLIVGIGIVKRQPWARIGGIVDKQHAALIDDLASFFRYAPESCSQYKKSLRVLRGVQASLISKAASE